VTTLVSAGRTDEAQRVCGRLLENHPGLTVAAIRNQLLFEADAGARRRQPAPDGPAGLIRSPGRARRW